MAKPAWTAESLRAEIEAFLESHHTVSLATLADDGSAHAANVLYALDGLSLVWTSDTDTRHSRHIAARSRIEATIAPDYDDFRKIRGLQIEGEAKRLDDAGPARSLLMARYSFLAQLATAPAALLAAWRKAAFYRLTPSRITLIDNTRGFGHKATLLMDAAGTVSMEPAAE